MNRIITHASLFSGIGAPELAAFWLGWQNVFHCEISDFCNTILNYWYPNSIGYENIKKTDFSKWQGKIDVLTGGFPCQPFSSAGQRLGANDDRYLWPEMLRAIRQVQPTFVIGENVAGILSMVQPCEAVKVGSTTSLFGENDDIYRKEQQFVVETVCADLEREGYAVQPFVVPACAVGAPHQRDRVWFIARRNVPTPSADTMHEGVLRRSRIDESQDKAQRIQERNEIQQSAEPDSVLRYAANSCYTGVESMRGRKAEILSAGVAANAIGRGDTTQQESTATTCEGRADNGKSEEWRATAERIDGLHQLSWASSHSQCSRGNELGYQLQPGQSDGDRAHGNGGQWNVADSMCPGLQETGGELQAEGIAGNVQQDRLAIDSDGERRQEVNDDDGQPESAQESKCGTEQLGGADCPQGWWRNFPTVTPVCRGNDGLPFDVSRLAIPFTRWRQESIKALGNSMVPQVVLELFRAIEAELE
jgi:DNA (cytosine-5)-methyltransferase 1